MHISGPILAAALLSALSSITASADYLEYQELVDIVEDTKRQERPDKCHYLVHQFNEYLSESDLPPVATPEYDIIVEEYLLMGRETSVFAQKLEYIKIFVQCLNVFGFPTIPFEYYAHMILTEPTKKLDDSDVRKSGAWSSLVAIPEIRFFVTKWMLDRAYSLHHWFTLPEGCRPLAVSIRSMISNAQSMHLSNDEVMAILQMAKASAVHSRDMNKIILLTTCLEIYQQPTLSVEFYRELDQDLDDILPESLSDIYDGVLIYEEDDITDPDHPSVIQIAAGIANYNEHVVARCLILASDIFQLVHPDLIFDMDDSRIFIRLIKILKYGRAASRRWRQPRNENIFRDCIRELELMSETITSHYSENDSLGSEDDSE